MFEGSVKYEYDERIYEYNWYTVFFVQFVMYFILHALVRRFAPSPGDIKTFKEKKRIGDYHTYYF